MAFLGMPLRNLVNGYQKSNKPVTHPLSTRHTLASIGYTDYEHGAHRNGATGYKHEWECSKGVNVFKSGWLSNAS